MNAKEQTRQMHQFAMEEEAASKRYPVGTKLIQVAGGPTGEIVAVKGNSGKLRVVRTAGVDREAFVEQIDGYIRIGKLTIG